MTNIYFRLTTTSGLNCKLHSLAIYIFILIGLCCKKVNYDFVKHANKEMTLEFLLLVVFDTHADDQRFYA